MRREIDVLAVHVDLKLEVRILVDVRILLQEGLGPFVLRLMSGLPRTFAFALVLQPGGIVQAALATRGQCRIPIYNLEKSGKVAFMTIRGSFEDFLLRASGDQYILV